MADQLEEPVKPQYGYWYTPLAAHHYPSPLHVTGFYVNGVTEYKNINVWFFRGDTEVDSVDHEFNTHEFELTRDLAPGPYYAKWSLYWRESWSVMTPIDEFYVRTPPE